MHEAATDVVEDIFQAVVLVVGWPRAQAAARYGVHVVGKVSHVHHVGVQDGRVLVLSNRNVQTYQPFKLLSSGLHI